LIGFRDSCSRFSHGVPVCRRFIAGITLPKTDLQKSADPTAQPEFRRRISTRCGKNELHLA
jgi:hypothetical protein